jgi:hypothetical protein
MVLLLIVLGILVAVAIMILITRALRKGNKGETLAADSGAPVRGISQRREPMERYVKRCPTCQSIYSDETLAFCLSDGSILERAADTSTSNDPNATLVYSTNKRSDIAPTMPYHPDILPNKKV